jgi:toxin-antitoxin system PIN domain toxin
VLVYAHRADAVDHVRYREWLETLVNGSAPFGLADLVLSGFVRIVTHPRLFRIPTALEIALAFTEGLRERPNSVTISPGERHWEIFTVLCHRSAARGNFVPDAYLAALAIESGSEWITADRDYARFPGLKWRHPLTAA